MKKTSYIILAGLSLVAAVSCSKQFDQPVEPEVRAGVPMTLTASIGKPGTRVSYTENDEGTVLKAFWNANEQISVISVNEVNEIMTIDTFVTGSESEGQRSAVFSGEYHGEEGDLIWVVYPALMEYDAENGYYGTELISQITMDGPIATRAISEIRIGGEPTLKYGFLFLNQETSGSTGHLGQVAVMQGWGDINEDGSLDVALEPVNSVLRLDLYMPDYEGLQSVEAYSLPKDFAQSGAFVQAATRIGSEGYLDKIENWECAPIVDDHFIAYLPFVPNPGFELGPDSGALEIHYIAAKLGKEYFNSMTVSVDLKNSVAFEPGKMYRLSVDCSNLVDLGLPSGLKWAKWNLGATSPEEYGDYFAWGETTGYYAGKTDFSWANYKWMQEGKSSREYINKYTFADNQKDGIWYDGDTFKGDNGDGVEHKDFASYDYVDDAARANWGGGWRTPTDAEWTELRENCTWDWKTTDDGYAANGYLVTGPNGNSIFLPAAGRRGGTSLYFAGSYGDYWSSSLYEYGSDYARYVCLYSEEVYRDIYYRYYGFSVRAVCD